MTKVSERANLVGSIIGQADLGSGPEVELSRFPKRFGRYLPVRASQWTQPIMRTICAASPSLISGRPLAQPLTAAKNARSLPPLHPVASGGDARPLRLGERHADDARCHRISPEFEVGWPGIERRSRGGRQGVEENFIL